MESRKLLIGIPKKGDDESFDTMLNSLLESTNAFEKILIATGDEIKITNNTNKTIDADKIGVLHANYKTPLEAYNRLFQEAIDQKADLLVTQTDVLFPKLYKRDWLSLMRQISRHHKAVVIPINGGGISGPDYINGFEWLGGWCTYYPYEVLKEVGGFDENFPNGYGVDIDHSYRCSKVAKIIKMNYWVDHHMMNERTHDNDPESEKAKREAAEYFRKKWKLQS